MMNVLQKFLICDNPIGDHTDYVLHTQKPKALFKVLKNAEGELLDFETLQEIDRFSDFTSGQMSELMQDLRQFYIDFTNYMVGMRPVFLIEDEFKEAKKVDLEDAYAMNLLDSNSYQIPSNKAIERVTTYNYLKVCYQGEMFWCIVAVVDRKNKKILAYISEELPFLQKHGLEQGDGIVIEPHHIFEIEK